MKNKFILSMVITPLSFCPLSLPLVSCSKKDNQQANFSTDSWDNVISYANKGIKALIDHYKPNGGTFVITPSDITKEQISAKTRIVHIDGFGDFKVRVVGECIDKIDNDTNAALTFEFSEIITKDYFHDSLDVVNPSDYQTSHIKTKLQQILGNFPNALKNNIKTVKQITAVPKGTGDYDPKTSDEKLFIMTLDEVYGVLQESETVIFTENYCYQNYQYSTHQTTNYHIKQYLNPETKQYEDCAYWLRTPFILAEGTDKTQCFTIDNNGFFSNKKVNESIGISPCFCLGNEKNGIINIGVSAPGFDITSSQIVDSNQDITIDIEPKKFNNQDVCKIPDGNDTGKAEFRIFTEAGRIYNDKFFYDASTREIKFIQNRVNKSLVFEMWNSKIILDYKNFVSICKYDEDNLKNGNFILNYFNVGNWLPITIDGKEYKVNIIGIYHDNISDSQKAGVTLEFYDKFEDIKWDDNCGSDWISSSLNKYLNGTQSSSIINKIETNCPNLYSAIKNVHKNVFAKENNEWVVKDTTTKLFILSDDEFVGSSHFNETTLGYIYDWYSINKSDIDLLTRSGSEIWTRSAYIKSEESNEALIFKLEMGKIRIDVYKTNETYTNVTPAFCI